MYPESVRRMAFRITWLVVLIEAIVITAGLTVFFELSIFQASGVTLGIFAVGSLLFRQIRPSLFTAFYVNPVKDKLAKL